MICKLSDFSLRSLRGAFNYERFYDLPENSLDVIFVGPSTSYCGFSPLRLYEQYGYSSYNFGSSSQSMLSSYLWAKEAYDYHDYKVIFLDASSILLSHGEYLNDIRALYSMGKSKNYFELATVYKRNAYKIIFPVFAFHNSWKTIREYAYEDIPNPELATFRGFVPLYSNASDYTGGPLVDPSVTEDTYIKTPYLDKLVSFCEEKGIRLILVKTTMANSEMWSSQHHNAISAYAQANNLTFLDFNEASLMEDAGLLITEHVAADRNHLNVTGAHILTDYIGNYLSHMEGISLRTYESSREITEEIIENYYITIQTQSGGNEQ